MNPIVYIILALIGIVFTRAIFSIGTIVRNLKAQTYLLSFIARKMDVPEYDILKQIRKAEDKFAPKKPKAPKE
jgi:hypothetical protein